MRQDEERSLAGEADLPIADVGAPGVAEWRWASIWRQIQAYYALTKPRVVALILFTAIVGMLLATPGIIAIGTLLLGTIGIGLGAASAAAVNHVIDQHMDAKMSRTAWRPIATGGLGTFQGLGFAALLAVLSMIVLVEWVNVETAVLTLSAMIGYAIIYTGFLKRTTPQNIVWGGAAGAVPPVLGWCAVTGHVSYESIVLFSIIFFWTPPHFWALALHYKDDYAKAKIPMLPVTHGEAHTRTQILVYTVILVLVTILPFAMGNAGWVYLVGASVFNAGFLGYAIKLKFRRKENTAIRMFAYSIVYLMGIFSALLIDHYLTILRGVLA
ncbi:heme o synthase [Acidihalobacter prosperus]|uniref:Protoheme IX farnesyltransferase n=1 Tax=Acidihalobacter prosperus TaxID=160660 RepID=A0A1A6C3U3_9GAMM|nr:heme o synthase [Acidihalobacter prosperus]OBS09231.1 protoheme IX farnesyltransferase [Acidihalobacter prosperus]